MIYNMRVPPPTPAQQTNPNGQPDNIETLLEKIIEILQQENAALVANDNESFDNIVPKKSAYLIQLAQLRQQQGKDWPNEILIKVKQAKHLNHINQLLIHHKLPFMKSIARAFADNRGTYSANGTTRMNLDSNVRISTSA